MIIFFFDNSNTSLVLSWWPFSHRVHPDQSPKRHFPSPEFFLNRIWNELKKKPFVSTLSYSPPSLTRSWHLCARSLTLGIKKWQCFVLVGTKNYNHTIIIRVVWLLWASDVWACGDQWKYFLADPRRLQTNFFFLGEFESWLKTYHAIGPGESFWFLVDTRAAQILPIVLGMALACYNSGLVGECFFYNSHPDNHLLYLLALWGGPRSNQPLVFVNNIVMQIWIFFVDGSGITYPSSFLIGWTGHRQTTALSYIWVEEAIVNLFQRSDVVVPNIFRWSETFGFFVCLQIPPPLSSRADSATWEWSNLGEHIKNSNISVFLTSFQNPDGLILIQPLLNILLGLTC